MRNYVIALYIRLSVEDFKTESLSIPNQKLILREKAMSLPEWDNSEILEFIDNGHTGTNFERPAVQELLTMVQAGKINCIIVKDLSRFGRNSIETGYFIERVFPLYHTRFISVSDDFDTANFKGDTGGIDIAFKYLISECYSRDMSMKTKSAKYAKMRRGEYQSVICPYGYRKSADGRMEPDEDVAPNVQMIFQWASEGNTAAEITRRLYAMNIPTPGEYRKLKGKDYYNVSRTNGVWSTSTVLRILEDQRYIGTYVIGKRKVKEIGSRHTQLKDESEWFKIPNHHPAIVSVDLFEKANASIKRFSLLNKKPRDYLLRGKVFCGCCDHAMSLRNGAWFYCRHSEVAETLPCHGVRIKMADLEQVVFETIRAQMCPALGIDSNKDKLDLQTVQQAEHEEKLRSIQDSKAEYTPEKVVDISNLSREDWLEYRKKGIGGSDVAAIMGISPFATIRDLFYNKTGVQPVIQEEEESNWVAKEVGHRLEDLVAEIFSKKTGLEVFPVRVMFRHPLYPFMLADVDFFVRMPDGTFAILECKTCNYNAKDKWADEGIPAHYVLQVRHYLSVMNMQKAFIACLYGNNENEFVYRTIERDLIEEEDIIDQETYFWQEHVLKNVVPPHNGNSDLVLANIRNYGGFADKSIPEIVLSGLESKNLEKYLTLSEEKSQLEKRKKEIEAEQRAISVPFVEQLGQGCKAVLEDGTNRYRITYNPTRRTSVGKDQMEKLKNQHPDIYEEYTKTTESRTFRIKKEAA